jgi:endonuclease/exonuclease/phosphatase (EEP) superfamily protein YafD
MPLRILTMNLYNGAADPTELAAVLDDAKPDVVAVQELSRNSAEVLSEWASSALLDPRDDTLGMGVAARWDLDISRLEFPHRNPIVSHFAGNPWGLPPVELVNLHITNPISMPMPRSWRRRRRQLAAVEDLLSHHDGTTARVLVGDFNSSPAWPFYKRVATLATDGALQAGTARRTWGYYPNSPRTLRIDHVFLQGPIRCVGTELVKVSGADHRGLLIDLEPLAD